jgi:hypothetical protein
MSKGTHPDPGAVDGGGVDGGRRDRLMRWLVWGGAAVLLLLPLVAMQFTRDVDWDGSDFAVIAVMLLIVCGLFELALRLSGSPAYRAGFGLAIAGGFLLVWVNLAVGMIGSEQNPYNLWFGSVLAVGLVGALLARFRAAGMVRTLVAAAIVQALVSGVALIAGWDPLGSILSAFWILIWLTSARCFHHATDTSLSRMQQKLKAHALLSLLAMAFGGLLLGVMVVIEGEPGLLPLVLLAAGVGWHLVTRYRSRRLAS